MWREHCSQCSDESVRYGTGGVVSHPNRQIWNGPSIVRVKQALRITPPRVGVSRRALFATGTGDDVGFGGDGHGGWGADDGGTGGICPDEQPLFYPAEEAGPDIVVRRHRFDVQNDGMYDWTPEQDDAGLDEEAGEVEVCLRLRRFDFTRDIYLEYARIVQIVSAADQNVTDSEVGDADMVEEHASTCLQHSFTARDPRQEVTLARRDWRSSRT